MLARLRTVENWHRYRTRTVWKWTTAQSWHRPPTLGSVRTTLPRRCLNSVPPIPRQAGVRGNTGVALV